MARVFRLPPKALHALLIALSGFVGGLIIVIQRGDAPLPPDLAWLGLPLLMGLQGLSRALPSWDGGGEARKRRGTRRVTAVGQIWSGDRRPPGTPAVPPKRRG